MKVLFVTKGDETLASTRYRVLNLLSHLEQAGLNSEWINVSTMSTTNIRPVNISLFAIKVLKSAMFYDTLYIQKVLFPEKAIKLFEKLFDSVIYDFDDALYAPYPWENNKSKEREQRLRTTLKHVSAVTTGSPVLTDFANQYAKNVYCLPTSVPQRPYEQYSPVHNNLAKQKGFVIIGWIGNPSNLIYLQTIEKTLKDILSQHKNTKLMIITSGDKPVTPLSDREDVSYREWCLNEELELLSQADIGIRPLTDDEWTRGKGGFTSVIQCMALGLPVVVSPVGMLSDIVDHGKSGFLAENQSEWRTYLSRLIEDADLRKQMGNRSIEEVGEQRFWASQRAEDLTKVIWIVSEDKNISKLNR